MELGGYDVKGGSSGRMKGPHLFHKLSNNHFIMSKPWLATDKVNGHNSTYVFSELYVIIPTCR